MIRITITDRRACLGLLLLSCIITLLALAPGAQAAPDPLLAAALSKPSADMRQWRYTRSVDVDALGERQVAVTSTWDGQRWTSNEPNTAADSPEHTIEYRELKTLVNTDAQKVSETATHAVFYFKVKPNAQIKTSGVQVEGLDGMQFGDQPMDGWAYVRKIGLGAPYIYGVLLAMPKGAVDGAVAEIKRLRIGFGFQPDPSGKTMLPRSFGLSLDVKALMLVNVTTQVRIRARDFRSVPR
jgi:hypothetical protein